MTKRHPDEAARTLTYKDLLPSIDNLVLSVCQEKAVVSDLLLLFCAAAYSQDSPMAETIYTLLKSRLMPYIEACDEAADAFVCEVIEGARNR